MRFLIWGEINRTNIAVIVSGAELVTVINGPSAQRRDAATFIHGVGITSTGFIRLTEGTNPLSFFGFHFVE